MILELTFFIDLWHLKKELICKITKKDFNIILDYPIIINVGCGKPKWKETIWLTYSEKKQKEGDKENHLFDNQLYICLLRRSLQKTL